MRGSARRNSRDTAGQTPDRPSRLHRYVPISHRPAGRPSQTFWIALIFPAWVLLVSVYILVANARGRRLAEEGVE
jgi:hypothetical protein